MMGTTLIKISKIKPNPDNPRLIKDDKFKKLVTSIRESPTFITLNPIKVDEDMLVLGGNMRLKACKELKWKEVPYTIFTREMAKENNKKRDKKASYDDQCKELIIKDNMGYGEDDLELITQQYDAEDLDYWGKDIPNWIEGHEINSMTEDDVDLLEEFNPMGNMDGKQRVVFLFNKPEDAEEYLDELSVEYKKRNMAWQVDLST